MILADTSVWIDYLHQDIGPLTVLLQADGVIVHPFVIGELAVWHLRQRRVVLSDMAKLETANVAREGGERRLIDRHRLFGSGIGYIDAHLLTSALIAPDARLWTRYRRLTIATQALAVAAAEI